MLDLEMMIKAKRKATEQYNVDGIEETSALFNAVLRFFGEELSKCEFEGEELTAILAAFKVVAESGIEQLDGLSKTVVDWLCDSVSVHSVIGKRSRNEES